MTVVRDGEVVAERAYLGPETTLRQCRSTTKSVMSTLIGIAIEQEKIKSVDERVLSFFPDLEGIENVDDRKRAIRIEDLLTMRSGTDYHERGAPDADSPHMRLNALRRGWDRFYLSRPMVTDPGTHFQYDSGGVVLLSSLISPSVLRGLSTERRWRFSTSI